MVGVQLLKSTGPSVILLANSPTLHISSQPQLVLLPTVQSRLRTRGHSSHSARNQNDNDSLLEILSRSERETSKGDDRVTGGKDEAQ